MLNNTNLCFGALNVRALEDKIDKINDWLSDDKNLVLDIGLTDTGVFIKLSLYDETEVDYAFQEYSIKNFTNLTTIECDDIIKDLIGEIKHIIIESYKVNLNEFLKGGCNMNNNRQTILKLINDIERERELQDKSVTHLAKIGGISRQSYYNIKNKKLEHDIGVVKLCDIADDLGLEITIKNNNNRK